MIAPSIARSEEELPHVVILATGGTIAGSAESGTQAGYASGQEGVEVLINAIPELKNLANVTGEQLSNLGSQNMSDEIWLKLADRINKLLKSDDVDGIVTAGLGNGNLTDSAVGALKRAKAQGVAVVRASRVPNGFTGRNIELDDDALGFVSSYDLNPQKSPILLRLALLKTTDWKEIQAMFAIY